MKILGSWCTGLSVYRVLALKTSTVTEEQPNLPLAFMVLSKLDTSRVSNCQVTEILAEVTPPVCEGDSCYADITVGGWLCWYLCRFTPPLHSSPPGCGCKHGTPALQLFLLAWSNSMEASMDCRTCWRSWLSTQAIKLCGVCSKAEPSV